MLAGLGVMPRHGHSTVQLLAIRVAIALVNSDDRGMRAVPTLSQQEQACVSRVRTVAHSDEPTACRDRGRPWLEPSYC